MKIYFASQADTELAAPQSDFLTSVQEAILRIGPATVADSPERADVIVLEEPFSFKEWRHIARLKKCPLISRSAHKIITINVDDAANGLLRGLYTSLPRRRFDPKRHVAIPYFSYPNEFVIQGTVPIAAPDLLASWRGNTKSNRIRLRLLQQFAGHPRIRIEETSSWMNHAQDEKRVYVRLIQESAFSLCPAGWAPVTFRIYESMVLGRCPVIIADQFVPPSGPNWLQCAVFFKEHDIARLETALLAQEADSPRLGQNARAEWEAWLSPARLPAYYARAILACAQTQTFTQPQKEIAVWESFATKWLNGWTLPQRLWRLTKSFRK